MAHPLIIPHRFHQQDQNDPAAFNHLLSHYSPPPSPSLNETRPMYDPPHSASHWIDHPSPPSTEAVRTTLVDQASSRNPNSPQDSFSSIKHQTTHQSSSKPDPSEKDGHARRKKFLVIGYRRLAIVTLAGLFLILAAVALVIINHWKRDNRPSDLSALTGDSDGDLVSESGLGSARNTSSSSLDEWIDPFNSTTSHTTFAPDNGKRGGGDGYDSLIIFGASYCDNAHARPFSFRRSLKLPPYYKGRWTNGYVWNEYLSALIGPGGRHTVLVNYAFGGATVDNALNEAPVPDLQQQVSAFLSDLSAQSPGAGPANGKSLIGVWIGINSVTKIWNLVLKQRVRAKTQAESQDYMAKAEIHINTTVDEIFNVMTNVIHANAFKSVPPDFLLLPIPPAQLLLVNIRAVKGNLAALETLATLNDLFNIRFAARLQSFQQTLSSGQRVFSLDIPAIWRKFIDQPGLTSLSTIDQPCVTRLGICKSPESYLYWDTLHPTTHVHEQIAMMINAQIKGL